MPEKHTDKTAAKDEPKRNSNELKIEERYPVEPHDLIDEASEESFPASDPPSFTPNVGEGTPRNRKMQDQNKPEDQKKRKDAA